MLTQYVAETEHRSRHGHIGELYRDAEVHRLVQLARANERRTRLGLTRPTAWVAATLAAAGARVRERFVSPCGQFTLWHAEPNC